MAQYIALSCWYSICVLRLSRLVNWRRREPALIVRLVSAGNHQPSVTLIHHSDLKHGTRLRLPTACNVSLPKEAEQP